MSDDTDKMTECLRAIDAQEPDPVRNVRLQSDAAVTSMLDAVARTKGKGAVSVTLTAEYDDATGGVRLGAKVAAKVPQHPTPTCVRWVDEDGGLLAEDPAQPPLPGVDVARAKRRGSSLEAVR